MKCFLYSSVCGRTAFSGLRNNAESLSESERNYSVAPSDGQLMVIFPRLRAVQVFVHKLPSGRFSVVHNVD